MAPKRKVEEIQSSEDFRRLFASAIATYETAEIAVLWLMREYRFDLSILLECALFQVCPWDYNNYKNGGPGHDVSVYSTGLVSLPLPRVFK